MLKRLQEVQPSYNTTKMSKSRERQEREIQMKCKYPNIFTLNKDSIQLSLA